KGEVQLSAAERKEKLEQKRAEVLDHIHKFTLDPKTSLPHPMVRIENAIAQLQIKIDSELPADKQALEILKVISFLTSFSCILTSFVKRLPEVLPVKKSDILQTKSTVEADSSDEVKKTTAPQKPLKAKSGKSGQDKAKSRR